MSFSIKGRLSTRRRKRLIYIFMFIYNYIFICIYLYLHICIYSYVFLYICILLYLYLYILFIFIFIYIFSIYISKYFSISKYFFLLILIYFPLRRFAGSPSRTPKRRGGPPRPARLPRFGGPVRRPRGRRRAGFLRGAGLQHSRAGGPQRAGPGERTGQR